MSAKHTPAPWEAVVDPDDDPGGNIEITAGGAPKRRRPRVHTPTIRERRVALGLTQREVAAACGVSGPIICEAEKGREVLLTTALKIARFFGVPVEELWPQAKTKTPTPEN